MKLVNVLIIATFLYSSYSFADKSPHCTAYYQVSVGTGTQKALMAEVDSGNFGDLKLQANLNGFQYEVIWHIELDTFYMTLREGSIQRAFSTSRIPTETHNDSGLDITLQDGSRRYISCHLKDD